MKEFIRENKKALFFLLRFLFVYGSLSLFYALWIDGFGKEADPFSWFIGKNLRFLHGSANMELDNVTGHAAIAILYHGKNTISLFEGCNGLAVMILFFAFVFAYKGRWLDLLWFVPMGLIIIHLFNLGRLSLLNHLADDNSPLFHFMHKYLFSLIIYAGVFLLWVFWIRLANKRNRYAKVKS